MKEFFKNRYNLLGLIFTALGLIIILQLVNLQVINGEKYGIEAERKHLMENTIVAPRGNIMDRYGVPIATNRQGFTVEIVDAGLKNAELNEMLLRLCRLLEANGDTYEKNLPLDVKPVRFTRGTVDNGTGVVKIPKSLKSKYDMNDNTTAEEAFKILKSRKWFKIEEKYSNEDALRIMNIKYEMAERGFLSYAPLAIAYDVSMETVSQIEENHLAFPGVSTNIVPVRRYIDASAIAHILGYVRGISPEELSAYKDKGYQMSDIIGKVGIEKEMEEYLRGTDGTRKVEVDKNGRFWNEIELDPAVPGSNVILTINMKLQKVAMKSLEETIQRVRGSPDKSNFGDASRGAAVAIDVNTGEVLAMVSYPSYDPAVFLGKTSDPEIKKDLNDIFTNPDKIQLNRAIQARYAPGSTFKPLTAVAALEEGIITPDSTVTDLGEYVYYNIRPKCWIYSSQHTTHGTVNVSDALRVSCNYFFYDMGRRLGIDKLDKWGKLFGMDVKTGIDLPNEIAGALAGPEYAEKVNQHWYPGLTLYAAIGQSYNAFTPLQMVNYVATIANGGKRYKPYIVKKVLNSKGEVVRENTPRILEDLKLKPETLQAVYKGMLGVTIEPGGTATTVFQSFPIKVAGKTGTAQNPGKNISDGALFIGFAPADNPQIAVAIVIENGVHGSNAAPVAKDIFAEYFGLNKSQSTTDELLLPDENRLVR